MRPSWSDIRSRVASFARRGADETLEECET